MHRGQPQLVAATNAATMAAPLRISKTTVVSVVDEDDVRKLDPHVVATLSGDDDSHSDKGGVEPEVSTVGTAVPPPASAGTTTTTLGYLPSLGLAAMYCAFGVTHTISIRLTKTKGIEYDAAAVVFMMELTKLAVSIILAYAQDGLIVPVEVFCSSHRLSLWKESRAYAASSLIYALYNNMTFLNLSNFDAGTWSVFMQARIAVTGVLFTLLLKHALTVRNWGALGILTLGLMLKFLSPTLQINYRVGFILLQASLSALAGVYNEYVLKKHKSLSIHVQNFFMYAYALLFNAVIAVVVRPEVMRSMDFSTLANRYVALIIVCGALMGISAAFILKFINSIAKIFAAGVDAILTAVVGAVLLGDALGLQDVAAIAVVVFAITVYSTPGRGSNYFVHFRHGRVVVNDSP